jgi:precorrin-6A/cobalt-precorrin-6A reductase
VTLKILILGGTAEGRRLAERLSRDARFDPLLSFAGRTTSLAPPAVPHRVGGFGGAAGLASFLRQGGFEALLDLTHPFAARISANAVAAAREVGVPLLRLARAAWREQPGDAWIDAVDMASAAHALGSTPRRVFLSIGRLELEAFCAAPEHHYLVRAVDAFALPAALAHARLLLARGPFELAAERALLERERIEILVSKNSGTDATYAKIEAARALGLPVVMVRQPVLPACSEVATLEAAQAWLEQLQDSGGRLRGV